MRETVLESSRIIASKHVEVARTEQLKHTKTWLFDRIKWVTPDFLQKKHAADLGEGMTLCFRSLSNRSPPQIQYLISHRHRLEMQQTK